MSSDLQEPVTAFQIEPISDIFCEHSTAPLWDASTDTFYFVDVSGNAIHRYQPETGFHDSLRVHRERKIAFVVLSDKSDQLLVGCENSILTVTIEKDNKMSLDLNSAFSLDITIDMSKYRFVFGTISPYGELYFSVEPSDRKARGESAKPGDNVLYRMVPPKEQAHLKQQQYALQKVTSPSDAPSRAQGLCWDHGGRSLYVTDSVDKKLLRYVSIPFRSTVENREDVIDLSDDAAGGVPVGVAVDRDGHVWVAMHGSGEILCIDPAKSFADGRILRRIKMPVHKVTSCTFAGPGLEHLYVTSQSPIGNSVAKIGSSMFRVSIPGQYVIIMKMSKSSFVWPDFTDLGVCTLGVVGGATGYRWKRFATAGRVTGTFAAVMAGAGLTVWSLAEFKRLEKKPPPISGV